MRPVRYILLIIYLFLMAMCGFGAYHSVSDVYKFGYPLFDAAAFCAGFLLSVLQVCRHAKLLVTRS